MGKGYKNKVRHKLLDYYLPVDTKGDKKCAYIL